jgi:hypothetical protein
MARPRASEPSSRDLAVSQLDARRVMPGVRVRHEVAGVAVVTGIFFRTQPDVLPSVSYPGNKLRGQCSLIREDGSSNRKKRL